MLKTTMKNHAWTFLTFSCEGEGGEDEDQGLTRLIQRARLAAVFRTHTCSIALQQPIGAEAPSYTDAGTHQVSTGTGGRAGTATFLEDHPGRATQWWEGGWREGGGWWGWNSCIKR